MTARVTRLGWSAVLALAAAVLAWLLHRATWQTGFAQDDWVVLTHVLNAPGMPRNPLPFWRPWEDVVLLAGLHWGIALYKPLNFLLLGGIAALTARLAAALGAAWWQQALAALFVAVAPMNALVIYQADMVSQLLATLMALIWSLLLLRRLDQGGVAHKADDLLLAVTVCVASFAKETVWGQLALPFGLWLCARAYPPLQRRTPPRLGAVATIVVVVLLPQVLLRLLFGALPGGPAGPQYAPSHNPLHWLINGVLVAFGNIVTVPSSRVLGRPDLLGPIDAAAAFAGPALLALAVWGLWRRDVATRQGTAANVAARPRVIGVALMWLAAMAPAALFHSSESYVLQGWPFLVTLLVMGLGALPSQRSVAVVIAAAVMAYTASAARVASINAPLLAAAYQRSETLRCALGQAPDCRGPKPRHHPESLPCAISPAAWQALRGTPKRPYSLYYGPVDTYITEAWTLSPEAVDPRSTLPACAP